MRFGQAEFPRNAGMADAAERRSARAAGIAGDQHHIGMRLGDPGRNRSHAHLGHQLDRDARARVDVLQVVNQLRQVFDRINVVMRRRRNQAHPRNRVAHARDLRIHLVAGKLAAFAGFGALRHLDLQFVGVHQVIDGDAEAAGGHLLDGGAAPVPEALLVLAALAGVRFAANAVHRQRQRFVRFLGNGAERHGAGGETLDDGSHRLDLFDRNRLVRLLDFQHPAQRGELPVLPVDQFRVFLERGEVILLHRVLHLGDGLRIEKMVLAARAILIGAADGKVGIRFVQRLEGVLVFEDGFARQNVQIHALYARDGAGEIAIHQAFG